MQALETTGTTKGIDTRYGIQTDAAVGSFSAGVYVFSCPHWSSLKKGDGCCQPQYIFVRRHFFPPAYVEGRRTVSDGSARELTASVIYIFFRDQRHLPCAVVSLVYEITSCPICVHLSFQCAQPPRRAMEYRDAMATWNLAIRLRMRKDEATRFSE